MKNYSISKVPKLFQYFFKLEYSSGVLLMFFAVIAIILANSGLSSIYNAALHTDITIGINDSNFSMPISHIINDGLMAIFFFVVGMEIKKEMLFGELKSFKTTILPIAAAIGGMIVPAAIYAICNYGQSTIYGFGIPMATDIAFALGAISLVGKKAPRGIVVFLMTLAIVDDLGAIIVIVLFYTNTISWFYLFISAMVLIVLILANKFKVNSSAVFIILGIILWFTILKSGVHATFSGVLLGLIIPAAKDIESFENSMLHKLEHKIAPWSSFVIMPIFALANAGVVFNSSSLSTIMTTSVSVGIIFGLFFGKPLGIFLISFILVKLKIAKLPSNANWKHMYGVSVLSGIGFTMSIFVSSLAFTDATILSTAKISIIVASLLSATIGLIIFKVIKPADKKQNITY